MRPSSFVSAVVLVSALALLAATACGTGGESRPPTTTVQGELVGTSEEGPVQLDEAGGDREEDEDGDGTKGEGKEKDKGKAHGQGGND